MNLAEKILGLLLQFAPQVLELIKRLEDMYGPGTGATKKHVAKTLLFEAVMHHPDFNILPPERIETLLDRLIELELQAAKATGLMPA